MRWNLPKARAEAANSSGVSALLEANGVLYEGIHAPGAALGVGMEVFARTCVAQTLMVSRAGFAARFLYLLAQERGDADDIRHDLVRVLEGRQS